MRIPPIKRKTRKPPIVVAIRLGIYFEATTDAQRKYPSAFQTDYGKIVYEAEIVRINIRKARIQPYLEQEFISDPTDLE